MDRWGDFISFVKETFFGKEDSYAIIISSDCFDVLTVDSFIDKYQSGEKVLDVRVFDNDRELRLVRDYIGNDFTENIEISDDNMTDINGAKCYSYDDEQYLDIDMNRSVATTGKVRATGGGEYTLPFEFNDKTKVLIRNYVDYDEKGQAYLKAWRVVGFRK